MKTDKKQNTIATMERLALQADCHNNSIDLNSIFTSENVRPVFQTHKIDFIEKKYGIAQLIKDILSDNGAFFPANIEESPDRQIGIAKAMLSSEIYKEVQKRFSHDSTRYALASVQVYLHKHIANEIGIINLTKFEDSERVSNKPRAKYYLINKDVKPYEIKKDENKS